MTLSSFCIKAGRYLLEFVKGISTDEFRLKKKSDFPNAKHYEFFLFSWLSDWVMLKSHRDLADDELPTVDSNDKNLEYVETLDRILKQDSRLKFEWLFGRLNVAIYKTFMKPFLILITFGLVRDAIEFSNVLLLKSILNNMEDDINKNELLGGIIATSLCILQIIDIFFDTHFFFYYYRLEIRVESTLGALICKRTLYEPPHPSESGTRSLGAPSRSEISDNANLLNLQLFDIENVSWGILAFSDILLTPIRVVLIAFWMYKQVGKASSTSTLLVGLITFIMCLLQIKSSSLVKLYLKRLDNRVSETQNVLNNMRTLRLIRWIEYSRESIITSRTCELQICNKRSYLYAVSHWLGSVLPYVVSLITFILYLINKTPDLTLDASVAIPLMHTITYLIRPLKHLSGHLADYLSGIASIRRIAKHLDSHSTTKKLIKYKSPTAFSLRLESLTREEGMCIVINQAKLDKSDFVTSLRDNIESMGFTPIITSSSPWMPSGTIRSVITFFQPYNEILYNEVVEICGLTTDFGTWEHGDLRNIDERGTSLSTGQRTRIALARALYYSICNAHYDDIQIVMILDNVFSVLDPGLSGEIFFSIHNKFALLGIKSMFLIMDEKVFRFIHRFNNVVSHLPILDFHLDQIPPETALNLFPTTKLSNLSTTTNGGSSALESPKSIPLDSSPRKAKPPESLAETIDPQIRLSQRYGWYLRQVGYLPFSFLVFSTITASVSHVVSDFIIGKWTSDGTYSGRYYLYTFTLFTSLSIFFEICKSLYQAIGNVSGAKNTYESSITGILNSPITLYDVMPIGRIINRLSTDQNYVDHTLFHRFCEVISSFSGITMVFLSLCYFNPICIAIFPFIALLVYYWVFKHYMKINKNIMKRTLKKRGPFCTVCSQCIDGKFVSKDFGVEKNMYESYVESLWRYQRMRFVKISCASWALLRLRALSLPLEFASAAMPLFRNKGAKKSSNINDTPRFGLALSYSFAFAKLTRHLIHTLVQLETEMCCATRLQELASGRLCEIRTYDEQEDQIQSEDVTLVIEFPAEPFSFSGERYEFKTGHYGIVGRTGAGKSTLLNYISGILPFEGRISLNGVNLNNFTDSSLGEIVGVIPHDVPILTGWTIRNYINPQGTYPDSLIYEAVEKAGISNFISNLEGDDPLSTVIVKKNDVLQSPFSALILQHISLARLILHGKNLRVILIDEPRNPTRSNILPIAPMIAEHLSHCITFIIAHNISSLKTCKTLFLVENGRIIKSVERDSFNSQDGLAKFIKN